MNKKIISIRDLEVKYLSRKKVVQAINGLSIDIFENEFLGIVGDAGTGKSVLQKSLTNLIEQNGWISSGSIIYDAPEKEKNKISDSVDLVEYHRSYLYKDTINDVRRYYKNRIKSLSDEIKLIETLNINKAFAIENKLSIKLDALSISFEHQDTSKLRYKISVLNKEIKRWRRFIYLQLHSDAKRERLDELIEEIVVCRKESEKIRNLTFFDKRKLAKIIELISEFQEDKKSWTEDNIFLYKKYFMHHEHLNDMETLTMNAVEQQIAGSKIDKKDLQRLMSKWDGVKNANIVNKVKAQRQTALLRGATIASTFQNPSGTLNPLMSVGVQLAEVVAHINDISIRDARPMAIELLEKVVFKNPAIVYKKRPSFFSLSEKQKINIAIAVANKPKVLICDDPVSILDSISRINILNLISKLKTEFKFTVVLLTHDIRHVVNYADRIAIMYAGQIVEFGTAKEVITNSQHPYTWNLLASLPEINKGKIDTNIIAKDRSGFDEVVKGDKFAPRNPNALEIDFVYEPPFFQLTDTHYAKTWLLDYRSPKIERPEIIKNIDKIFEIKEGE
jgi:oligopeptide transport system ATP-binding protein